MPDKTLLNVLLLSALGTLTWLIILTFLLLSVPVYLYRYLILTWIAPCWSFLRKNNLKEAVTPLGNAFALEFWNNSVYTDRSISRCSIVMTFVLEGNISTAELQKAVEERWLNALGENGKLLYPEFQQYIDSWMGFMFWKQCNNFQLIDHIKTHVLSEIQSQDDIQSSEIFLNDLVEKLLNRPFQFGKSPWELHLVQNYRDSNISEDPKNLTAVIIRIHHAMGDAISIIEAMVEKLFEMDVQLNEPVPRNPKTSSSSLSIQKLLYRLIAFLRIPYDMGHLVSTSLRKPTPWIIQDSRKSWNIICEKSTKRIPISKIKAIKSKFGVSFPSVLFSCMASVFANHLGKTYSTKFDKLSTMSILPLPNHPQSLRNHFTSTFFDLPINPNLDPASRLKLCAKNFQNSLRSMIPYIAGVGSPLSSAMLSHLAPVAKLLCHQRTVTCTIPVISISHLGPIYWNGRKLLTVDLLCGLNLSDGGIAFQVMSYIDHIQIMAAAESAVVTREDLKQAMSLMEEEIEKLYSVDESTTDLVTHKHYD